MKFTDNAGRKSQRSKNQAHKHQFQITKVSVFLITGSCPPEDVETIDCYKPEDVPAGSSLVDIIPGIDYNATDRYLAIVYFSQPGKPIYIYYVHSE